MNVAGPIKKLISLYPAANDLLSGRVFPIIAPQNTTFPLAVVTVINNNAFETKSGVSTVDNIPIRIDIFAKDATDAIQTDDAVRDCIDGFRGDVTNLGVTVSVDGIKYLSTDQGIEDFGGEIYCRSTSIYQFRWKRDGQIGGVFMHVDDLNEYVSNEAAILAGLAVGDWYIAAAGHKSAFPGTLIKIKAI